MQEVLIIRLMRLVKALPPSSPFVQACVFVDPCCAYDCVSIDSCHVHHQSVFHPTHAVVMAKGGQPLTCFVPPTTLPSHFTCSCGDQVGETCLYWRQHKCLQLYLFPHQNIFLSFEKCCKSNIKRWELIGKFSPKKKKKTHNQYSHCRINF